jgi:hypothetical protein
MMLLGGIVACSAAGALPAGRRRPAFSRCRVHRRAWPEPERRQYSMC